MIDLRYLAGTSDIVDGRELQALHHVGQKAGGEGEAEFEGIYLRLGQDLFVGVHRFLELYRLVLGKSSKWIGDTEIAIILIVCSNIKIFIKLEQIS